MTQRLLFFLVIMAFVSCRITTALTFGARRRQRFSSAGALFASSSTKLPKNLKGVIFDMDGTLVRPCIDFGSMRRRIYSVASRDFNSTVDSGCVLELATQLSPSAQDEATAIFHEIETQAIQEMKFMDGMIDLCQWLDLEGIQRALLTRNVERSVNALHDKLPLNPFSPAVARNTQHPSSDNYIKPKPHPDAIEYICETWNCMPSQVLMVGDSLKDDVVAANRAGSPSIFLDTGKDNCSGNEGDSTLNERQPSIRVTSLMELQELLVSHYYEAVDRKKERQQRVSSGM